MKEGIMKQKIAIYLAGTIKKAHERTDDSQWSEDDMHLLKTRLQDHEIAFLNPAFRTDDLNDQMSVYGRDMFQVFCSDIVFVDARERRGLGVGVEMMWAKLNKIPLIIWAPKDSHYNKTNTVILGKPVANYIHPFVISLSDKIVETLDEGAAWIKSVMNKQIQIKGIEHVQEAMDHYQAHQLENDEPMQNLINSHPHLFRGSTPKNPVKGAGSPSALPN